MTVKHYSEALAAVPGIESMELERYARACESIAGCLEELPIQMLFRHAGRAVSKTLSSEDAAQFDKVVGKLAEGFAGERDKSVREDAYLEKAERVWLIIFMSLAVEARAHEAAETARLAELKELDQENRRKGIHPPDGRALGKGTDAEALEAAQREQKDWLAERKRKPNVLKQLFDFGWDYAQGPREVGVLPALESARG